MTDVDNCFVIEIRVFSYLEEGTSLFLEDKFSSTMDRLNHCNALANVGVDVVVVGSECRVDGFWVRFQNHLRHAYR